MTNSLDTKYIETLKTILDTGTTKSDRTGTGTISVFGLEIRHNLAEGFPLLTTKKVHFKSVVGELLWFISGSQDIRRLAELTYNDDTRNTIWTPNALDMSSKNPERFNGYNVGNMYSLSWRYSLCTPHSYTTFERRTYVDDYSIIHTCPTLTKTYPSPVTRSSNECGDFTTLGKADNKFVVYFKDTGSYRLINTVTKSLKDLYKPSVEGVGYIGGETPNNLTSLKLRRIWQDMLIRVYNPRKNHCNYSNITVCKRWHSLKNFVDDAYSLLGFQEFVDSGYQWQLDKDYWGSSIYSPDTCMFISPELNKTLNGGGQGFKVYLYKGETYYSRTDLQKSRKLTRQSYLPEDITILEDTESTVVRPVIYIDQLDNLISQLKNNPNSRTMVVDAWNDRGTGNAILNVCHPLLQCYVANGKLSLMINIRSNDMFLGNPFNIASYALLTHMLAQICNLEVGELIWRGGDCHIYLNHIDQVNEQIGRHTRGEIFDLPSIELNKDIMDIDDFTYEDITLCNYQSGSSIKGEVSV